MINSFVKMWDHGYDFVRNKGMSRRECDTLYGLANRIVNDLSTAQKEGYILGYKIDRGIREEFDILRFNDDFILNIELKSELPKCGYEGIRNQLVRHRYLLSVLHKDVYVFTYVHDEGQLYSLNEDEKLTKISFDNLHQYITEEYIIDDNLQNLNMDHLIISPYSEPERFNKRRYFLTDEQIELKEKILTSPMQKICLSGGPGTGKTLLLVELAKSYIKKGKRVVIVFGSKLDDSEANKISKHLEIEVLPIKKPTEDISVLYEYDVVLVDEGHRIWKDVFDNLLELDVERLIFAMDINQAMHPNELQINHEKRLKNMGDVDYFKLKYRIRTNREISSFIRKFMNVKDRKAQPYNYDRVKGVYFDNREKALEYIDFKTNIEGFKAIELTEYWQKTGSERRKLRKHICRASLGTHDVIGREFDKVLVILDQHFYHNEEGKLASKYDEDYPYLEARQVFQALTRVKDELIILTLENRKLYQTLQEILTWKKTRNLKQEKKKEKV